MQVHSAKTNLRLRTYSLAGATAYGTAVALAGGRHKLQFRLGQLLEKLQNWAAAAAAYEAALALDDSNADWHFRLSKVRSKLEDWRGAAAALEAALARDDSRAAWHFSLGAMRSKLRDWPGAATAYEAALARDGRHALWHAQLGLVRVRLREWPAAADAFEAALARDSGQPDWYYQLGTVRRKMQDLQSATECFASASCLAPDNATYRGWLGNCLARVGKEADARAVIAPLITQSDTGLTQFLSLNISPPKSDVSTDVVRTQGSRTLLSRKVTLEEEDSRRVYFESLKVDNARSRRISHFYDALETCFGTRYPYAAPSLHHKSFYSGYGYFLYDYREQDSNFSPVTADGLDLPICEGLVDSLAEISCGLKATVDTDRRTELADIVSAFDVQRHLANETARDDHDDDEYEALLREALKRCDGHADILLRAPKTVSHGDLQVNNVVVSSERSISILDWESYGWGPAGLDLVSVFRNKMDCPAIENLVDRYFDTVAPQVGHGERRRIIAVEALFLSSLYDPRRVPNRWLSYLT